MNAKEFDEFLSENGLKPNQMYVHPLIWNGYWSITKRPKWFSRFFRFLGRRLHSRRLYWIGFSIYWVDGLKTLFPDDVYVEEVERIDL